MYSPRGSAPWSERVETFSALNVLVPPSATVVGLPRGPTAGEVTKIFGYQPQRNPAKIFLPDSKPEDLRQSLLFLADNWEVDVVLLHWVVGIC